MAQMHGIFCIKISKNLFNPNKLIDLMKKQYLVDQIEEGLIICYTSCSKARFRINYEYFPDQDNYGVSLNRFSGDGFIAAKAMKHIFDIIPDLFKDQII